MKPRRTATRWLLACSTVALLVACSSGTNAIPADGGTNPNPTDGGLDADRGGPDGATASAEWLSVRANRIVTGDGRPFHGRGANLHDTRSCMACAWQTPDTAGVNRWADELIDRWHANFIRLLLESLGAPVNPSQVQWRNLVDDDGYYRDIQTIVAHIASKPGVYVMVTLFSDPTIKPNNGDFDSEWPTTETLSRYRRLAEAFYANPRVLFGLTNEPHGPADRNAELAARYQAAIAAIRAVEDAHGAPHHIVVAQAPQGWAREVQYFVDQPLTGDNIAYEIHPYNPRADFDRLIVQPSRRIPLIIGEYGPAANGGTVYMSEDDVRALWTTAQANEVPYLGWNFHQRCPPNMLQDTASDGCGLAASTNYSFPRTSWGDLLHDHLATPW
jgi:hypothetical protein